MRRGKRSFGRLFFFFFFLRGRLLWGRDMIWSGPKEVARWIEARKGFEKVHAPQWGWEYLIKGGYEPSASQAVKRPGARRLRAAAAGSQRILPVRLEEIKEAHPAGGGRGGQALGRGEARLGLKPVVIRRVWAPPVGTCPPRSPLQARSRRPGFGPELPKERSLEPLVLDEGLPPPS